MPYKLVPPDPARRKPNYSVRGTHQGVRIDKTTGTTNRKVAVAALKKFTQEADSRRFSPATPPVKPTFATGLVHYVEAGGEDRFTDVLNDHLGDLPMNEIDQRVIATAAMELYPHASNATRNRQVYTPVLAVLKHNNIAIVCKRPKEANGTAREAFLEPQDADRLIETALAMHIRFGALLVFLLDTGCRLSEALALRPTDMLKDGCWCWIPRTKNGKPRMVFLTDRARSALRLALMEPINGCYTTPITQPRSDSTVFCLTKGGHIYELLEAAEKASGVKIPDGVSFHIFRHSYGAYVRRFTAYRLTETGAWASPQGAASYDHFDKNEAAMAARMFPGAMHEVGPNLKEAG